MAFAIDIDNYKILPWIISVRLAFYLPWLEILCGAAVITRKLYLGGLSILAALTSVFIIASIVAKARGLDITCGCFGHASKYLSFAGHLALDFAILAALIVSLWRARSPARDLHDQETEVRRLSIVFAQEKSQDRQTSESRHLQNKSRREEARESGAVL